MTTKLKEWLRYQWRTSNLPKYQHYFDGWVDGLTDDQIQGFEKQMYMCENNVLGIRV